MNAPPPDLILRCGPASAAIRPFGAELRTWRIDDVDLLWTPEPAVWNAVSPILFPIVGRLRDDRLRIGGHAARLGVHGFAARSLFSLEDRDARRACFLLRDDEATRAIFPFRFTLRVDYALSDHELEIRLTVENPDEADLLYACGLHPGFRWPFDGGAPGDYYVEFERNEAPYVPTITDQGLFESTRRPVPLSGRRLRLERALFAREALCFLNVESRIFRFVGPNGRALSIETSDFPHFALWSRPPSSYVCLESWTGHGDRSDAGGDFFDKPDLRRLPPGAKATHASRYRFGC